MSKSDEKDERAVINVEDNAAPVKKPENVDILTPIKTSSKLKYCGTPPSSSASPFEEPEIEHELKAAPWVDDHTDSHDLSLDPPEFENTKISNRRMKVAVPSHMEKSLCSHCGNPRPKRRGPQCGAFDPTERKWYCYLCWRQFRKDIYDLAIPNVEGENCVTCSIHVLTDQGKYMNLGEQPGTEPGLYCPHCWEGWINSLPHDADWLKKKTPTVDMEIPATTKGEAEMQEVIGLPPLAATETVEDNTVEDCSGVSAKNTEETVTAAE